MSAAESLEPHWGYAERVVPCVNDAGTCEYLDAVYDAHDLGMIYVAILWATILGIVFVWSVGRRLWPSPRADAVMSAKAEGEVLTASRRKDLRLKRTLAAYSRRYLLPDAAKSIFGRITRLQVLILAILAGYLLIWTLVGIVYKKWVTPVTGYTDLFNIRTGLGPWSNRIGLLAYALTPLSILLSSRESLLSALTGVPYQSFNFLHRWLGYIILIQSSLHTIGWSIVEIKLYQPQPETAREWITQVYMIWGVVAMLLLLFIFALSTPWGIRLTGYEFFRKAHYILAMVYIGACWAHWKPLRCFLLPSLLLWFLDRGARLIRTALIHHQYLPENSVGFKAVTSRLARFPDNENGDVIRMDFEHSQEAWKIGQHFYLCFTEGSIWQSHPFTPLNLPEVRDGVVAHSYIFRAKRGETKKINELAAKKLAVTADATTPVILQGPYGESITESLTLDVNVLCVAGGTGITYVLPVLLDLVRKPASKDRKIELIWAVRRKDDVRWIEKELDVIRNAAVSHRIGVNIFVTREQSSTNTSLPDVKTTEKETDVQEARSTSSASLEGAQTAPAADVQKIGGKDYNRHPNLAEVVNNFVENTVRGSTVVYASGPGGMISDLRSVVASCNSGSRVWRGDERFDVRLACDDRLEW
ncbi:hypothetical protein DL764_009049 [Monosporascus ibericus]|uniref:FAD-binding FR-type domain-containing protein n=1 Tax=Monosporascus ibericus TaxID=155417 RepID=A0A4Q4SZ19_9PEZI|nr:hypothetical protein DL764_009049 [Monosporascus ibericus]